MEINLQRKLDAQLLQTQKMEVIGWMAGGIAHDLNNILAAIMGFTELALNKLPEDAPGQHDLKRVLGASDRGKELVGQILSFSRQGGTEVKPLRIDSIVKEALKLLRALLPPTIEICKKIDCQTGIVVANPSQIYQVLMNLCTNAAHAMHEKGGLLEVRLQNVNGDTTKALSDVAPGSYVRLAVSDDGYGISPEVREHIFDPFFTTKEKEGGTGLGLAVVQDIVKSYGGAISVTSKPAKRTEFSVYLPMIEKNVAVDRLQTEEVLPGGDERILVVDDESYILEISKETLENMGYTVAIAQGGLDALELLRATPDLFDLVITDLTMPNMTGLELAAEIQRIDPRMPMLLFTGFCDAITSDRAAASGIREIIMKPATMLVLARAVRNALDDRNCQCSGGMRARA